MPYSNIPKSKWSEMERCVASVKSKGGVDNPYAICYSSIMNSKKHKYLKKAIKKAKK